MIINRRKINNPEDVMLNVVMTYYHGLLDNINFEVHMFRQSCTDNELLKLANEIAKKLQTKNYIR